MEPWFPAPGARVVRIHDGAHGTVHAVYPHDQEDDCEVLLDEGIFTCSNHRHFAPEVEPIRPGDLIRYVLDSDQEQPA